MKRKYEVGDEVWIFAGEKTANGHHMLSKGTVVHSFFTPYRLLEQYVVLLDDPDFLAMELRDCYLMTPDPNEWPAYTKRGV